MKTNVRTSWKKEQKARFRRLMEDERMSSLSDYMPTGLVYIYKQVSGDVPLKEIERVEMVPTEVCEGVCK